jgi:hypothetical protein
MLSIILTLNCDPKYFYMLSDLIILGFIFDCLIWLKYLFQIKGLYLLLIVILPIQMRCMFGIDIFLKHFIVFIRFSANIYQLYLLKLKNVRF